MTNCDLVCPHEVCHLLTKEQVSAMGFPVLLEGGVQLSALSFLFSTVLNVNRGHPGGLSG